MRILRKRLHGLHAMIGYGERSTAAVLRKSGCDTRVKINKEVK